MENKRRENKMILFCQNKYKFLIFQGLVVKEGFQTRHVLSKHSKIWPERKRVDIWE